MASKNEIEDLQFDLLLQEKRHKELIKILTAILKNIETADTDSTKAAIELLLQKTNDIPSSIQSIADAIMTRIEKMNSKQSEWIFDISRDSYGYITTLTAKKK